jgi:transposase
MRKPQLAGVPVVLVDPRNTSRECPECGHCEKGNRQSQAEFECRACGHQSLADFSGARVVRLRSLAIAPIVRLPVNAAIESEPLRTGAA